MPRTNLLWIAALLAAANLHAAAEAGGLEHRWVSAEAKWLLHVDVEGFLGSKLGRFILEQGEALDIDLDEFDEMRDEMGFDPREDLASVTVYGVSDEPNEEDAVLLAVTTPAVEEMLRRAKEHPEVSVTTVQEAGYELLRVGAGDGDRHYAHIGRLPDGKRLVVIASEAGMVAAALSVVDGKKQGITRGKTKLLRGPRDHSFVFVAASGLEDLGDWNPASEVLRLSEGFAADLGERDGALRIEVTVAAHREEDAKAIADIAGGIIALGRVIGGRDPELAPIARLAASTTVETKERRINLKLGYEIDELIELLQSQAKKADYDNDRDNDDDDDDDDDDDEDDEDDW